ncbi:MAG TPA: type II toxin-antitoxin system prevent-host-death family antitoxin [Thermoanaerobaculia bacterium]|nr:type II toxin-antitoxin system prevent-host-death family antitoxin [Thermoanaerobaculia bacterium]
MTTRDYDVTMERVGIADLKAHLSRHLRRVRSGKALTVVDRGTPVATLVPFSQGAERLVIRPPSDPAPLAEIPLPPPLAGAPDVVDLLLQERQMNR